GDGPASPLLMPHPRDLTFGRYELRTTESGSIPTDDDLIRTVRQGIYGTAMPAWQTLLTDTELHDVVEFVKTLSPRFTSETPAPVAFGAEIPSSPDSVARGQQV